MTRPPSAEPLSAIGEIFQGSSGQGRKTQSGEGLFHKRQSAPSGQSEVRSLRGDSGFDGLMEAVIAPDEIVTAPGFSQPCYCVHSRFEPAMDLAGFLTQYRQHRSGLEHQEC